MPVTGPWPAAPLLPRPPRRPGPLPPCTTAVASSWSMGYGPGSRPPSPPLSPRPTPGGCVLGLSWPCSNQLRLMYVLQVPFTVCAA